MTKPYAAEETALKHLKNGKTLSNEPFLNFWNNKKLFAIGIHDWPRILEEDDFDRRKFTEWWTTWQWEEDFVADIFDAHLQDWEPSNAKYYSDILLRQLPPKVTDNLEYAKRALGAGIPNYHEVMNPIFWTHPEITPFIAQEIKGKAASSQHVDLIGNPEKAEQELKNHTIGYDDIPRELYDDCDFVRRCFPSLDNYDIKQIYRTKVSYRIRKLVGDNPPGPFLDIWCQYNQVNKELTDKDTNTGRHKAEVKRPKI